MSMYTPPKLLVMKILIADDHKIVRVGLILMIKKEYPLAIIDEANTTSITVDKMRKENYDLIVIDIHMEDIVTIQLIKLLLLINKGIKIVVMSYLPEDVFGIHYLQAGVKAFINKGTNDSSIIQTINDVLANKNTSVANSTDLNAKELNPFSKLSEREVEILNYLLQGLSTNQISDKIHLKHTTVSTYKTRLFEKLETSNIIHINELVKMYTTPFSY